jgi:hypothetical protein
MATYKVVIEKREEWQYEVEAESEEEALEKLEEGEGDIVNVTPLVEEITAVYEI